MPLGTAVLDFGVTPTDVAQVDVTGQATILATSRVEAFFMRTTSADHGVDEHEEAAALCRLVCGNIVAGASFTIYAHAIGALGTGRFNLEWAWV